jgi:hypothetical protein
MDIWGNYLPFVGFRTCWVNNDGEPTDIKAHWEADMFCIEWLGFGWIFYIGEVRPAKSIKL